MASATFMHHLWSYGSLLTEWPFLPWGLGGESSCCKSGLLHSVKTPAGSCTSGFFLERKKEGKWQMLFLVSVTISRLKFVMYLFWFLNRVFTSNYLLKLWRKTHTHTHSHPHTQRIEILLTLLQVLIPVRSSLDESKSWIIYLEQRSCSQIIDANFCLCSWSEPCSDLSFFCHCYL